MEAVAIFHSPFKEKFGIPRQSGVVSEVPGFITLAPPYRTPDAIRGLEDFDYLWLVWQPNQTQQATMVRPPRLGGNRKVGIFASRSPIRPNPIGLSSVLIDHIDYDAPDAPVIYVKGADILDGTPILDIKPYIAYTDAHPDARGGFTDKVQWQPLEVIGTDDAVLRQILQQDPRPHYHDDPERIYGMQYGGRDIHFKVCGNTLTVL